MRDQWRCNWRPQTNGICASCLIVDAGGHADNTLLIPFLAAQRRALAQLGCSASTGCRATGDGPVRPPLLFTYRSTEAGDAATIGHLDGLITLDLDEADPAQLEQIRTNARRAVPHAARAHPPRARPLRVAAIRRRRSGPPQQSSATCSATRPPTTARRSTAHYARGDDGSWRDDHVSFYAAAHPWEDYAESWAQVMHVHDVVSTGSAWGVVDRSASDVRAGAVDVDGGAGDARRQRAGAGDGDARSLPVRPVAGRPAQDRGGVASDTARRFRLTRLDRRPRRALWRGRILRLTTTVRDPATAVAGQKGEHMRSRSRVRSMFVPLAIVGVLGAASVASAGTDTTTPDDTAAAGTEPAGTERAVPSPGTEAPGTEPAAAAARGGAGRRWQWRRQRHRRRRPRRHRGVDHQRRDLGQHRGRCDDRGPQRVRRGQRDHDQLRRHRHVRGRHRNSGAAAALHPTSRRSRSRVSSPRSPRTGDVLPLPDDVVANVSENWPAGWIGVRQRRRHPVRRADQGRPQVARLVHAVVVRRGGLRGTRDARRLLRPHRADDRER